MKLQTKQLKAFDSIAGQMKPNTILPILSYLKFDNGLIIKSNLESFVTMEADFEGSFLVDEKILMSFVNSVNADEINIEIKGTTVVISNGKEKITSPTDEVVNYPVTTFDDLKETELSQEILSAVKIASNFTMDREDAPYAQCVFLGNGMVGATTGYIAYVEKTKEKLPEIVLEKSAVSAIKNFHSVTFSQNDSHQFFANHIFKFGFVKKETKYINLAPFVKLPNEEKIKINKSEIIRFCDTCINSSQSRAIVSKIEKDKLSMIDSAYGIDYEKPLEVELKDFSFNSVFMSKMLKAIPAEEVYFIRSDKKYIVTDDNNFVSLIMEMQS